MEQWYENANTGTRWAGNAFAAGFPARGVLHTTEGGSAAGAIAAYKASRAYPHFTVDTDGSIFQHVPLGRAATALEHPAGTRETNNANCYQIEIVGFSQKQGMPRVQLEATRELMVWLELETGIKRNALGFKAYPGSYGRNNGVRLSAADWQRFNGWCGHQHVPSNLHGDPGAIDIGFLLTRASSLPKPQQGPYVTAGPAIILGDEDMIKRQTFSIPISSNTIDENGNGWLDTGIPFDQIVSFYAPGLAPERDGGYGWSTPRLSLNNTDGKGKIVFKNNNPTRAFDVVVHWLEPK